MCLIIGGVSSCGRALMGGHFCPFGCNRPTGPQHHGGYAFSDIGRGRWLVWGLPLSSRRCRTGVGRGSIASRLRLTLLTAGNLPVGWLSGAWSREKGEPKRVQELAGPASDDGGQPPWLEA